MTSSSKGFRCPPGIPQLEDVRAQGVPGRVEPEQVGKGRVALQDQPVAVRREVAGDVLFEEQPVTLLAGLEFAEHGGPLGDVQPKPPVGRVQLRGAGLHLAGQGLVEFVQPVLRVPLGGEGGGDLLEFGRTEGFLDVEQLFRRLDALVDLLERHGRALRTGARSPRRNQGRESARPRPVRPCPRSRPPGGSRSGPRRNGRPRPRHPAPRPGPHPPWRRA